MVLLEANAQQKSGTGNLLVRTTLLSPIAGPDANVYVRAPTTRGTHFVRKKARDLQEGDLILVNNDAIEHKTLEDILPSLRQSQRYATAENRLYSRNTKGAYVPNFRIALLRCLASPQSNLEEKIFMEGNEGFSGEELASFVTRIEKTGVTVKEDAIYSWLDGTVLAPKDWENLNRLSTLWTDPDKPNPFKTIYDSKAKDPEAQETTGYYADYCFYTGARRSVMAYLERRRGGHAKTHKDATKEHPQTRNKFDEEISLVLRQFFQEIDHQKSVARVLGIQTLPLATSHGEPEQKHAKREYSIQRGLVHEQTENVLNMAQMMKESALIDAALQDSLSKYCSHIVEEEQRLKNAGFNNVNGSALISSYLLTKLIRNSPFERYFLRLNLDWAKTGPRMSNIEQNLDFAHQRFLDDLTQGKVDDFFRTESNTYSKVIDLVNQYRNVLPQAFGEWEILFSQRYRGELDRADLSRKNVPRRKKRDLDQQVKRIFDRLKRVEAYLERTYGVTPQPRCFAVTKGDLSAATDTQFDYHEARAFLTILGIPDAIKLYSTNTFKPSRTQTPLTAIRPYS